MKKALIIIIVLSALILFSGCLNEITEKRPGFSQSLKINSTKKPIQKTKITPEKKEVIEENKIKEKNTEKIIKDVNNCLLQDEPEKCILSIAVKNLKEGFCEYLKLRNDECYNSIAQKKKDLEVCSKIINKNIKNNCYNSIARKKLKEEGCEKITEIKLKDECFLFLANKKENIELCENVSNSKRQGKYVKDNCYWNLVQKKLDENYCELFKEEERKEDCYNLVGIKNKTLKACNKVEEENLRNSCLNKVAKETKKIDACYYLNTETKKEDCIKRNALSKEPDERACNYFQYSITGENCYYRLAKNNSDENYCLKIARTKTETRYKCLQKIALNKKDANICDLIDSVYNKQECYYDLAQKNNELTYCESILSDKKYMQCFKEIGVKLKTGKVCNEMKKASDYFEKYTFVDSCKNDIALTLKYDSICTQIINPELDANCLGEVRKLK